MPNIKIFVDETQYSAVRSGLAALLPDLRTALCSSLRVDNAAFQIAVIPVLGMADQPQVNVEMQLMPRPERTREVVSELAGQLRASVAKATGQCVAVRVAMLDAATYVALK
ncbi:MULTISPECIES: hypothetical protein [unclassified Stappia]|uniref:hypothetical protein n=1 Tax=unclassified Stappia TaxID=2629676 RepID=UPI0016480BC0|nr:MULTISPECIES: hypothetical protein [unclassified Stappia]